jgi:hypothetical protein
LQTGELWFRLDPERDHSFGELRIGLRHLAQQTYRQPGEIGFVEQVIRVDGRGLVDGPYSIFVSGVRHIKSVIDAYF